MLPRHLLRRCRHVCTAPGREPLLFTPGPLTTSATVKQAMLVDLGSRDPRMTDVIAGVRQQLLDMGHVSQDQGYECVIMQGSGTFAVESVLGSVVPRPAQGGRILIASNGAYGDRMAQMCRYYGIDHHVLRFGEREAVCSDAVAAALRNPPIAIGSSSADATAARPFSHVGVIHHETTAGTLNNVEAVGRAVRDASRDGCGANADGTISLIVDSMSAFGCYDVDLAAAGVSYLVSSSNKCIEGVPGFAFALCERDALQRQGGAARSLSLDLLQQWEGLERTGQFRFTPPTHALLAFAQALAEHAAEGGAAGRRARYEGNARVLQRGMADMGFDLYLDEAVQGCIISTFLHPDDANFDFDAFYAGLADLGIVIYPGKLTEAECFRLGTIGRLFEHDMLHMLQCVRHVLGSMGVAVPVNRNRPTTTTRKAEAA